MRGRREAGGRRKEEGRSEKGEKGEVRGEKGEEGCSITLYGKERRRGKM